MILYLDRIVIAGGCQQNQTWDDVNKYYGCGAPSYTGDVVSSFVENYFGGYISDTFTAEMEDELDEISRGEREYKKTLTNFYGPFLKEVKSKVFQKQIQVNYNSERIRQEEIKKVLENEGYNPVEI